MSTRVGLCLSGKAATPNKESTHFVYFTEGGPGTGRAIGYSDWWESRQRIPLGIGQFAQGGVPGQVNQLPLVQFCRSASGLGKSLKESQADKGKNWVAWKIMLTYFPLRTYQEEEQGHFFSRTVSFG